MDSTGAIIKNVAELLLEEEGGFQLIVNADLLKLPIEGTQRLVLNGKATTYLRIEEEGVAAGISINRYHHDAFIPWDAVFAVEGESKAFYCRRPDAAGNATEDDDGKESSKDKRHLRLVKG